MTVLSILPPPTPSRSGIVTFARTPILCMFIEKPIDGSLELGIVELPYRSGIKCLAFADKAGKSYDLAISARTGIPPGSYRLSYGVLTGGGLMTVVAPTEACPTYEIQAGKINVVRIGTCSGMYPILAFLFVLVFWDIVLNSVQFGG